MASNIGPNISFRVLCISSTDLGWYCPKMGSCQFSIGFQIFLFPSHSWCVYPYCHLVFSLCQFTRNYTQTTKRGLLTTKRAEHQTQESARCSARFVVRGFQRGLPLGTRLCLRSVVCYTLCRRCRENAVANRKGNGIWSGRKTGLWLRGVDPQAQGWFHQQTGRIWKPPSLVSGKLVDALTKNQTNFSLKIEMGGKPF